MSAANSLENNDVKPASILANSVAGVSSGNNRSLDEFESDFDSDVDDDDDDEDDDEEDDDESDDGESEDDDCESSCSSPSTITTSSSSCSNTPTKGNKAKGALNIISSLFEFVFEQNLIKTLILDPY